MAIGYNDEFDYLEDEASNAEEEKFAPQIKGSIDVSTISKERGS